MIFVRKFFDNFFFILTIVAVIALAFGLVILIGYLVTLGYRDAADGNYFGMAWKWGVDAIIVIGIVSAVMTANELVDGDKK
jgi:hypothetical protein